jgi:3D (Asp-Asp-Asp) domain-containing protein
MRLINMLSKRNLMKMLVIFCILSMLGLSTYTFMGSFGRMIIQPQDKIATNEAEAMNKIQKPGGPTSSDERMGIFTAYTSRPRETSRQPYITADQTNLKEHRACVVANNRLKLGTKIQIKGIGTCEIHDRIGRTMGANHFDIYMGNDVQGAKKFGTRKLQYSIIGGPEKDG